MQRIKILSPSEWIVAFVVGAVGGICSIWVIAQLQLPAFVADCNERGGLYIDGWCQIPARMETGHAAQPPTR